MSSTRPSRPAHGGKPFTDYEGLAVLLEKARRGDRRALGQVAVRLTPMLWQVARAQGLDSERSADAVQSAWLSLLGSIADIRTPVALTAWLVTVTKRTAWRMRDDHSAETPTAVSLDNVRDPEPQPEEHAVFTDRRRRLWAAVAQLPRRCQDLLRFVAFVHRLDYAEVSAALGMPRGSIGPVRGRCLARLRTVLLADEKGSWR
ncbi:RNA polymerase sigma factor [Actinokineospora iranica]|uniref:RNA polymerase sigma factor, sigma-70 family n=1 Tax=Actinokineospora iranica TaxID=1271860 RepID=A0A1G6M9Z4_9PSEU|nr:sigma-70 family RNA polymerase sigma factor [Actinokineospora iranica]SDC51796.1 RNA polymerase sigma factor, sigma-70 family [Actinokineospora iranica]